MRAGKGMLIFSAGEVIMRHKVRPGRLASHNEQGINRVVGIYLSLAITDYL